jgi:hypothetical protein
MSMDVIAVLVVIVALVCSTGTGSARSFRKWAFVIVGGAYESRASCRTLGSRTIGWNTGTNALVA